MSRTRRLWSRLAVAVVVIATFVTACDGQQYDLGDDEPLWVDGATFVRAPLPRDEGGPDVRATYLGFSVLPERAQEKSFTGVLGPEATAAALAFAPGSGVSTEGHWLVPASAPLPDYPELPSFDAPLSFGEALLPGAYELHVVAVDADGRAGAPRSVLFQLAARPEPEGELVFSLDWDRDADLDLHVVTPDGTEIYDSDVREGLRGTGATDAESLGGRLDFDSNAGCVIDGLRNENVTFAAQPTAGRYLVRVDTFSLCGLASVRWRVVARDRERILASASGISLPVDTRFEHGRGAGLLVLEVEIEP